MSENVELLKRIYDCFNSRDMETVLAALHEDVICANGLEGGHVRGRAKEYAITGRGSGQWSIRTSSRLRLRKAQKRMIVEVHQVVRDLRGNLLADKMVGHIFRVENGLVRRFDIRGT